MAITSLSDQLIMCAQSPQTLTAQKTKTLPERLMDTGVISNAVVAYALGRIGQW
jgi:hypothetical protein